MAAVQSPLNEAVNTTHTFRPPMWLTILLLLLMLAKVACTLYFANTTFDFTDGGCYMLWYAHPDKDPHPFYYFHKIVLGLFPFVDWNIISLRILKMCSEIVVVGAMSFAVYQHVKTIVNGANVFLFVFGFIGLAYFATWFSWIFYEYDMSYLHTVIALSLLLGLINTKSKWIFAAILVIVGVITGIQFFNKFSTTFLLFLLITVVIQLCRRAWMNHLIFVLGIMLGAGIFFAATGYSPSQWYKEYVDGYNLLIKPLGYHPLRLIWMYVLSLWPLPLIALSPILLHYGLTHILKAARIRVQPAMLFGFSMLLLLVVYYFTFPTKYLNLDNPSVSKLFYFWYFPLLSFLLYFFVYHIKTKQIKRFQWVLICVWFILPAVVFVGTSTTASLSLSSFLVPWYGLLAYLIVRYYKPSMQYPIAVIAFVSCFVFVANHVERPYWTNKPMYYPRVAVEAPNEVILLDTATAQFVTETKKILDDAGIEEGYPIVALHDLPGLVYLVGGYSPATPWYFNVLDSRQSELKGMMDNFNCLHISRIWLFESRKPVFIINQLAYWEVVKCLRNNCYRLTKDYERPRKVSNPTIRAQIERQSKGASDSLLIFIPKRPYTQTEIVD